MSTGLNSTAFSCTEIAQRNRLAPETNVLVVGMPNIGKSTLLNALRNMGIDGRKRCMLLPSRNYSMLMNPYSSSPDIDITTRIC